MHEPGKIVLDLAGAAALAADCAADTAVVRAQPRLFRLIASDPTMSRLIALLPEDVESAVAAIRNPGGGAGVSVAAGWGRRAAGRAVS